MTIDSPVPVEHRLYITHVTDRGSCHAVHTTFRYDPQDPFAIRLVFPDWHAPGGEKQWYVSRDLFRHALRSYGTVGEGRVQLWTYAPKRTNFLGCKLVSPASYDTYEIRHCLAKEFLRQTDLAVPAGCELDHLDFDAACNALLSNQ